VKDLFEGLVELDGDLNVVPALARRWSIGEDGLSYRFELRAGLRWSDGAPLTAHDLVFALRRNLRPATGAGQAYRLYDLAGAQAFHEGASDNPDTIGARAISAQIVELRLAAPTTYLLYLLADAISYPQPQHLIERVGADWSTPAKLVCSGPFRVSDWQADQALGLARNPHYRGYALGNLGHVELRFVAPDSDAYKRREVDWLRIEDQSVGDAEWSSSITVLGLSTYFLAFSCAHPLFSNQAARLAFAHCIDKDALVERAWGGVQIAATGGVVPLALPGYSPGLSPLYDPNKARALLGSAPLKHAGPLLLASRAGFGATAGLLAEAWREQLGVAVEVRDDLSASAFLEGLRAGTVAMALIGWDFEYPDPGNILRGFFHSASPLNYCGWQNARFDALVDAAATENDQALRMRLYHEAERLLVAEAAPAAPLYYHRAYGLLRPGFSLANGVRVLRGDRFRLKQLRIDAKVG